jgi:ferredoxin
LATGAAGALLLGTDLRLRRDNPRRIRPPGVIDESAFLSTCLRCSQCMKICPTTALQPALTEAGLAGMWTPILVPRVGYCDFGCTACGQVCPSGAIPLLALEEKRRTVIGKASIDRNRCLPWASAVPCVVCEEMCPLAPKAIRLEDAQAIDSNGEVVTVQRPAVFRDLCIGCGICEHHCPLEGDAAIRIYDA